MEQRKFIDGLRHTRYYLGMAATAADCGDYIFSVPTTVIINAGMLQLVDTRLITRAIQEAIDDAVHQR